MNILKNVYHEQMRKFCKITLRNVLLVTLRNDVRCILEEVKSYVKIHNG